jgi:hypothetical protein
LSFELVLFKAQLKLKKAIWILACFIQTSPFWSK